VTLCGWAHRRRDHGGVIFIDLRDREGMAQIVIDPDTPEAFSIAESVRNEFVLKVTCKVRARPEGTVNPNIPTGEVEMLASEIEILNPSLTPPFMLDDDNLSEMVRLEHRYIDLRRPAMQKNLMLRYRVSKNLRDYLDTAGFIEVETPMLTRSTPEGWCPVSTAISRSPNASATKTCAPTVSLSSPRSISRPPSSTKTRS